MIESPYVTVDINKIRTQIKSFTENRIFVYYPIKANPDLNILRAVYEAGCGFLVVNRFQLEYLIKAFPNIESELSKLILFDNCIASNTDIDYLIERNIQNIVIDSLDNASYLTEKAAERDIKAFIKIKIKAEQKFGTIDYPMLFKLLKKSNKLLGLSFYLPYEDWAYAKFEETLLSVCKRVSYFQTLNIGGGLKGFFADKRFLKLINQLIDNNHFTNVVAEPGRLIVDPSSKMVIRIERIRCSNNERWIYTNGSVYSGLLNIFFENRRYNIISENSGGGLLALAMLLAKARTA